MDLFQKQIKIANSERLCRVEDKVEKGNAGINDVKEAQTRMQEILGDAINDLKAQLLRDQLFSTLNAFLSLQLSNPRVHPRTGEGTRPPSYYLVPQLTHPPRT